VSPVFEGRRFYVSDGYGQGGRMFELAADGRSVGQLWEESTLDVHHGGAVLVDGRIYGAASNGTWSVLDAASGKVLAKQTRLGKGSLIYADGKLYGYVEKGEVLLVDPDPASFEVTSRFEIERGKGHHWAHPVIADGVLYIRHGDALMAFDVSASDA
jgi:outer membrane protein assembly factor BamB